MTIHNRHLGSISVAILSSLGAIYVFVVSQSFVDYHPNELTLVSRGLMVLAMGALAYQARKRQRFFKSTVWLCVEVLAVLIIVISFLSFVLSQFDRCTGFVCGGQLDGFERRQWVVIGTPIVIAYIIMATAKIAGNKDKQT